MRLLSIDPSIVHCGVAVIEGGKYISSYTYKSDPEKSVEDRLIDLARHFYQVVKSEKYDTAVIELPSAFIRKGVYGSKNVRSINLLHLSIGAIAGGLSFCPDLKIEFVKVQDWKGQGSKDETQDYARLMIGKDLNTHEADAFVMGIKWLSIERFSRAVKDATRKGAQEIVNPILKRYLRP